MHTTCSWELLRTEAKSIQLTNNSQLIAWNIQQKFTTNHLVSLSKQYFLICGKSFTDQWKQNYCVVFHWQNAIVWCMSWNHNQSIVHWNPIHCHVLPANKNERKHMLNVSTFFQHFACFLISQWLFRHNISKTSDSFTLRLKNVMSFRKISPEIIFIHMHRYMNKRSPSPLDDIMISSIFGHPVYNPPCCTWIPYQMIYHI